MPLTEKHKAGAFCWIELATRDQVAARNFYTDVVGGSFEDSPMGPSEVYTMFQLQGKTVGAAYTQRGDEVENHVPAHWNLYIAVDSADQTAKAASELGGSVLAPPFDVATYGRMAVIQDPNGAVFCIWEAKDHSGIEVQNQHGSFCWADLNTPGQQGATRFYGDLFGWTFLTDESSGYIHIRNGETHIGGIPPDEQRNTQAPPHWMIYLQTDDCDATTEKAKQTAAQVYFGPVTMETVGRFTVMADPQGAVLALFQPMRRQ